VNHQTRFANYLSPFVQHLRAALSALFCWRHAFGQIVMLLFHGVPDEVHPWGTHTPPEMFRGRAQKIDQNPMILVLKGIRS